MSRPRLMVAEPHRLTRSALVLSLAGHLDGDVLQAVDVADLLRQVGLARPDVLLVHEQLPGGGAAAVCSALTQRDLLPDVCRVLVLGERNDHSSLLAALEAGAHGYLSKDVGLQDVVLAVRALRRGEAAVPPSMLAGLLSDLVQRRRQAGAASTRLDSLSKQERRVLELLARGQNQDGIAAELVISPQTARTHIQNVIGKLGVHSRLEAVAVAFEHGLVEAS